MKGIVIKGSTGVKIIRSKFINLDTAVEAENSKELQLDENEIIHEQSQNKNEEKQ